jgi:hypothetical protein
MWTLARDIASASRRRTGEREPWAVDPLTRKVYAHSVTAQLEPAEADLLRVRLAERDGRIDTSSLSEAGRSVLPLLTALEPEEADVALQRLPAALRERLDAMSPSACIDGLRAPRVLLLHDRDDHVIPVSESRDLRDALAARRGVAYTEFTVFRHLDPTKGNPPPLDLAREVVRFARAIFPLFQLAADEPAGHTRPAGVPQPPLRQAPPPLPGRPDTAQMDRPNSIHLAGERRVAGKYAGS